MVRITSARTPDILSACLYLSIKPQKGQGLRSSLFILALSVALWNTSASANNLPFIYSSLVKLICCLWLLQFAALHFPPKTLVLYMCTKSQLQILKMSEYQIPAWNTEHHPAQKRLEEQVQILHQIQSLVPLSLIHI